MALRAGEGFGDELRFGLAGVALRPLFMTPLRLWPTPRTLSLIVSLSFSTDLFLVLLRVNRPKGVEGGAGVEVEVEADAEVEAEVEEAPASAARVRRVDVELERVTRLGGGGGVAILLAVVKGEGVRVEMRRR